MRLFVHIAVSKDQIGHYHTKGKENRNLGCFIHKSLNAHKPKQAEVVKKRGRDDQAKGPTPSVILIA